MTESATMRWEQFTEAAELFLRQGSFSQAEDALKGAIDAAREQRGERGDAQLARALARMAWLRSERGDKKGANELLDSALDAAERAGAAGDEALVRALHQPLAHLLAGGTMPSIEPRAERLLAIAERALGDSARGIALPLNTLARACFKRGDLNRAEQLLKRLLAIKRAESAGSIEVAAVHASLGKLFAARRQHDRAEEAWRFALAIREQALSPRDAAVANALLGLADACEAQGKRAQGKTLRERGLAIRETALGP
ncbi:MAG: tetratricopeptide repeat protein, partial [Gemmatimonadaceae bacterium]